MAMDGSIAMATTVMSITQAAVVVVAAASPTAPAAATRRRSCPRNDSRKATAMSWRAKPASKRPRSSAKYVTT
jgi:hypothetical protein